MPINLMPVKCPEDYMIGPLPSRTNMADAFAKVEADSTAADELERQHGMPLLHLAGERPRTFGPRLLPATDGDVWFWWRLRFHSLGRECM